MKSLHKSSPLRTLATAITLATAAHVAQAGAPAGSASDNISRAEQLRVEAIRNGTGVDTSTLVKGGAGLLAAALTGVGVIVLRRNLGMGTPQDKQQKILKDIEEHQPAEIIAAKNELVPWLLGIFPGIIPTYHINTDESGGISITFRNGEDPISIRLIKKGVAIVYCLFRGDKGYAGNGVWNDTDVGTHTDLDNIKSELSRIKNPTPPPRREPTMPTGGARAPAFGAGLNGGGRSSSRVPTAIDNPLIPQPNHGITLDVDPDPLKEADVYLEYGRDIQAVEILRAALEQTDAAHPLEKQMWIRAKLCQIYHKRSDTRNLRMEVTLIRDNPDFANNPERDTILETVYAYGRDIDADNPLYPPKYQVIVREATVAEELREFDSNLISLIDVEFPGVEKRLGVTRNGERTLYFSYNNQNIAIRICKGIHGQKPYFSLQIGESGGLAFFDTIADLQRKLAEIKLLHVGEVLGGKESGLHVNPTEIKSTHTGDVADGKEVKVVASPLVRKVELAVEFVDIGVIDGANDLIAEVLEKINTNPLSRTDVDRMLSQVGLLIGKDTVEGNTALSKNCQDLSQRLTTAQFLSALGLTGGDTGASEEDRMAAEWAAALDEAGSQDGEKVLATQPISDSAQGGNIGETGTDEHILELHRELEDIQRAIDSQNTTGVAYLARLEGMISGFFPGVSVERTIDGEEYAISIAPLPETLITVNGNRYESRGDYIQSMKAKATSSVQTLETRRRAIFDKLNTLFFQKFDTAIQDIETTINKLEIQSDDRIHGLLLKSIAKIEAGKSVTLLIEGQIYAIERKINGLSVNGINYLDDTEYLLARKQSEVEKIRTLEGKKLAIANMKSQFKLAYIGGNITENRYDFNVDGKKLATVRKNDGSIHVTTWDDEGKATTKILDTWMQLLSEGIITL